MKKTAFLFSGQGAQYVGMGRDIYEKNEVARSIYDMGNSIHPGVIDICFCGPADSLTQTENAQPCLFLTDLAIASALEAEGIKADYAAGFSLGEIPALAFTHVLSASDAFELVVLRGERMARCAEAHPGSMAAVLKLENDKVEEICSEFSEVWPVNYNCPGQLSCAGSIDELDGFCDKVKSEGGRAVKLAVSGAFHTPYMRQVSDDLYSALCKMQVSAPSIPLYANRTGEPYSQDTEEIRRTVSAQVCSPVYWEKTVRALYDAGVECFIEVGAGKTLTGLVKKTLPDAEIYTVNDYASLMETVSALSE